MKRGKYELGIDQHWPFYVYQHDDNDDDVVVVGSGHGNLSKDN